MAPAATLVGRRSSYGRLWSTMAALWTMLLEKDGKADGAKRKALAPSQWLEEAADSDEPKEAVIDLVIGMSTTTTDLQVELHAELQGLKLSTLKYLTQLPEGRISGQ